MGLILIKHTASVIEYSRLFQIFYNYYARRVYCVLCTYDVNVVYHMLTYCVYGTVYYIRIRWIQQHLDSLIEKKQMVFVLPGRHTHNRWCFAFVMSMHFCFFYIFIVFKIQFDKRCNAQSTKHFLWKLKRNVLVVECSGRRKIKTGTTRMFKNLLHVARAHL